MHYKIGIFCFSAKHAALRDETKDRLAGKQYIVKENDNFLSDWKKKCHTQGFPLGQHNPFNILKIVLGCILINTSEEETIHRFQQRHSEIFQLYCERNRPVVP
jgi:hypothetical protein